MMNQVSSMRSLICTEELATDVSGAEPLLERHNEHRTEIDARNNTFQVHYSFSVPCNIYPPLSSPLKDMDEV